METATLVFLDPSGPWIERIDIVGETFDEAERCLLDHLTDMMVEHHAVSWYPLGEFSFVFLFDEDDDLDDEDDDDLFTVEGI